MFRLKQFCINDSLCAMKVGTDGVLLGAWAETDESKSGSDSTARILDIGTGSGLIAMMLAQRAEGQIDAIDIDADATQQAAENFRDCPWSDRLHAYHYDLQQWVKTCQAEGRCYDAIVSNPPYFVDSLKNPNPQRTTARHTDTLSYEELVCCAERLLTEDGRLTLILPIEAEEEIIRLGAQYRLYPTRLCRVKGTARKAYKRLLIEFQHHAAEAIREEELILMDTNGARSKAYANLCKDYYL